MTDVVTFTVPGRVRGPRVSPETRADIIRTMRSESVASQAARLGVAPKTVQSIRSRDGNHEVRTQREMVIELLAEAGPYPDATALLHALRLRDPDGRWRGLGLHALHHQLGSMNRLALVSYDRRRRGGHDKLANIRLRDGVVPAAVVPEPELEALAVPTGAHLVEVTATVNGETTTWRETVPGSAEAWPVLAELRARLEAQAGARARVQALMAAAEALEGHDRDAANLLADRAAEVAPDELTPVEAEYLRHAEECGS